VRLELTPELEGVGDLKIAAARTVRRGRFRALIDSPKWRGVRWRRCSAGEHGCFRSTVEKYAIGEDGAGEVAVSLSAGRSSGVLGRAGLWRRAMRSGALLNARLPGGLQ